MNIEKVRYIRSDGAPLCSGSLDEMSVFPNIGEEVTFSYNLHRYKIVNIIYDYGNEEAVIICEVCDGI